MDVTQFIKQTQQHWSIIIWPLFFSFLIFYFVSIDERPAMWDLNQTWPVCMYVYMYI